MKLSLSLCARSSCVRRGTRLRRSVKLLRCVEPALLVNLLVRYDLQLLVGVFYSDDSISFLPITMQLFGAIWYVVRLDLVLCM